MDIIFGRIGIDGVNAATPDGSGLELGEGMLLRYGLDPATGKPTPTGKVVDVKSFARSEIGGGLMAVAQWIDELNAYIITSVEVA